jgi:hypothetical protein
MFEDETNILAAVFATREGQAKNTGHFVLIRVVGVVQNAIDSRAFTFIPWSKYIAGDGIRHDRHSSFSDILFRKTAKSRDRCHQ